METIDPGRGHSNGLARSESRELTAHKTATPALPNGIAKRLDLWALFEGREYRLPQIAERFWRRVDVYEPHHCWLWIGRVGAGGYSEHKFVLAGQRRVFRAHRLAYALAHWEHPIPAGMQVRHRCRERLCCNPRHLHLADRHGQPLMANGNACSDFEALLP